MNPTIELARDLIARTSITPEDAGCLDLIAQRLAPLGFVPERMDAGGVSNLWLLRQSAQPHARLLVFAGHVDVVPTGDASRWTHPPFSPTIADGKLYGRGASDMKSSIAAFVVALENFFQKQADPAISIALLLTSDEEGPSTHGTVHVVRELAARGQQLDWCIVGEPTATTRTGDAIKNGRRGSLSARIRFIGTQGHIAYPHLADNPIHKALAALAELAATQWDAGNAFFPPTSFQISNIHAGTGATNVIPADMVVDCNFRFSTESTDAGLRQRLEAVLAQHGLKAAQDFEITWTLSGQPFLTGGGELVDVTRGAIAEVVGLQPELSTSGGTSDGRFIATICKQVIEVGPPNATIHKIDEHIVLADLEPLPAIYEKIIQKLNALEAAT